MVFKQIWKHVSRDENAPHATDEDRGWREILAAAAIQGAVFAVVKAAVDRAAATGIRKATRSWPD
jgi:hypothetical protein